jgi:hypothetical protein
VTLVGEAEREKSTPVPLKDVICGLPLNASSVTVSAPVRVPVAVGVKAKVKVQWAPAAKVAPQLFVCEKSPLMEMLETFNVASPLFVSVTFCVALLEFMRCSAKVSDAGDKAAIGATPVPARATDGEAPVTLLFNVRVPVRLPRAVGVNARLTVQFVPAARVLGQLLDWAKSPAKLNPLMDSAAVPVLVSVAICAALVVPTRCDE